MLDNANIKYFNQATMQKVEIIWLVENYVIYILIGWFENEFIIIFFKLTF